MLLFLVLQIVQGDRVLYTLSGKNIHVLVAQHAQYALSVRLEGPGAMPFVAARDMPGYARRARISQDGDLFHLEVNGKGVCTSGGAVKSCVRSNLFEVQYHRFGYRIKKGSRCVTATPALTFERCSNTRNDQEFVLSDESLRYCLEALEAPTTAAERRSNEALLKAASRDRKLADVAKKRPVFEKEIEKLKPSPKMKKALKSLWDRGWGKGWGWGVPKFNIC